MKKSLASLIDLRQLWFFYLVFIFAFSWFVFFFVSFASCARIMSTSAVKAKRTVRKRVSKKSLGKESSSTLSGHLSSGDEGDGGAASRKDRGGALSKSAAASSSTSAQAPARGRARGASYTVSSPGVPIPLVNFSMIEI